MPLSTRTFKLHLLMPGGRCIKSRYMSKSRSMFTTAFVVLSAHVSGLPFDVRVAVIFCGSRSFDVYDCSQPLSRHVKKDILLIYYKIERSHLEYTCS